MWVDRFKQAVDASDDLAIALACEGHVWTDVNMSYVVLRGCTPFMYAVMKGSVFATELLLSQGADVNWEHETKYRAIHFATNENRLNIAKLLIQHGAHLNVQNDQGFTPLHFASLYGYAEMVELLLQHGAQVDIESGAGWVPLLYATTQGSEEVMRMLIDAGSDPRMLHSGWSLLHFAADIGYSHLIPLLLEQGVEKALKDEEGFTAADLAARNKHTHTESLLRNA